VTLAKGHVKFNCARLKAAATTAKLRDLAGRAGAETRLYEKY
jgi:hypothetical protein